LAYRKAPDFGICLIEKRKDQALKIEFIPPQELINDPPEAGQCARAIYEFCKKHRVGVVLLDGPQGWKDPESPLLHSRHCEKILFTQGKTGTDGVAKPGSFTPFAEFSIRVFAELVRLGGELVSSAVVNVAKGSLLVAESYPTSAWRKLGIKPLPGKANAKRSDIQGRVLRLQELLRFRVDREPTHDELQALVAGVARVAILAGKPSGYCVQGSPTRQVKGVIVEGFIVNPCIERLAA